MNILTSTATSLFSLGGSMGLLTTLNSNITDRLASQIIGGNQLV